MIENGAHPASGDTLAIVCGGGSLPFAVAEAAMRRGRRVVLFALTDFADPQRVASYPHVWGRMGQLNRFMRAAAKESCRDVVFIGSVGRPTLWQMRPDVRVLRLLPRILRLYRGGDDHLLSGIAQILEDHGFKLVGVQEIAPELLMTEGRIGQYGPQERDRADIERGIELLRATSPFDIGQAVVVADNQVLAIEGPEGTDSMLARVADMRRSGRIRTPMGHGVLVKAAKAGQHMRVDLPTIGPKTVAGVQEARLAGIAVLADSTVIAEPTNTVAAADEAEIFVVGMRRGEVG